MPFLEFLSTRITKLGNVVFTNTSTNVKTTFFKKPVVLTTAHRVLNMAGKDVAKTITGFFYYVSSDNKTFINELFKEVKYPPYIPPSTPFSARGAILLDYIYITLNAPLFVLGSMYTRVIPHSVIVRIQKETQKKGQNLVREILRFIKEASAIFRIKGYIGIYRSKLYASPTTFPVGEYQPTKGCVTSPGSALYTSGNIQDRNSLMAKGVGIGIPDLKHFLLFYPDNCQILYEIGSDMEITEEIVKALTLLICKKAQYYNANPQFDEARKKFNLHLVYIPKDTIVNTDLVAKFRHFKERIN